MFLITRILKTSLPDRHDGRQLVSYLPDWLEHLNEIYTLYVSVHRERATLARLTDAELRDIGLHRADAEHESKRGYFDIPEERKEASVNVFRVKSPFSNTP